MQPTERKMDKELQPILKEMRVQKSRNSQLLKKVEEYVSKTDLIREDFKQMKEIFSEVNRNLDSIKNNTKATRLQIWDSRASVFGSIFSLGAFVLTLFFGYLTYFLTVKYGESEQTVRDLSKVIDELRTQNSLNQESIYRLEKIHVQTIENNSKLNDQISLIEKQRKVGILSTSPLLRDIKLEIIPTNQLNNFVLSVITKNFGLRPAYDIKTQFIFFKLNKNGKIESHGKQTSDEGTQYQRILYPNEEHSTTIKTGYFPNGINDLNIGITRFEFNYYDNLLNTRVPTFFYYGFKVLNNKEVAILDLNKTQKKMIEEYMINK